MMQADDFLLRRAGLLLHPTSLPSGVLDQDVERWLDLLADAGFSVWQVLPLGEPQGGLSPYQCNSAFACNPALLPGFGEPDEMAPGFREFCRQQGYWLDDFALYKVLKSQMREAPWHHWPEALKSRQPEALAAAAEAHAQRMLDLKWQQFQLHQRWQQIRARAAERQILLFGDMPIFVAHDSADVWAHPQYFQLDEAGEMRSVTGVPPDYFSDTGQRWGNPHYDWDNLGNDGFSWWRSRIRHHLEQFDLLRIDHFRGLEAVWVIDADAPTAERGYWQKVPGDALLANLQEDCGRLPLVAEDLGIITPEVTALRKKYRLPGMSVLQFGFDGFADNPHKPENIETDRVAYTGTHDNDTTKGWFLDLGEPVKYQVLERLRLLDSQHPDWPGLPDLADRVVERLVGTAMASAASLCIIPMQDYLHLGSEARMNTPGTVEDNWQWRFQWRQLDRQMSEQTRSMIARTQRLVCHHG